LAEIFHVELSNGNGLYAELALPATDYELLDVLDRLRMTSDQSPEWEITRNCGFEYLSVYLNEGNLYELNALARKLDTMYPSQKAAFQGLFQIALNQREGPMSFSDLITYANSVDCCHVVSEATNDEKLGRFYAENGFIAELDGVNDNVFEMLNFAKIGKEMREAENGVYTRYGYVLQNDRLKPLLEDLSHAPKTPSYTLQLLVARYPFESDAEPEITATLDLPACQEELNRALEHIGAASWEEVIFTAVDSAIPGFPEDMYGDSFEELNDYAQTILEVQESGELLKMKTLLTAKGCTAIGEALQLADQLDEYFFESDKCTPEDVAREDIRFSLNERDAEILLKYVDLYAYGKELIEIYNSQLTDYGLIAQREVEPVHALDDPEPEEQVDIMWDDLKPKTQERLQRMLGDNGNFDVVPIATICAPEMVQGMTMT